MYPFHPICEMQCCLVVFDLIHFESSIICQGLVVQAWWRGESGLLLKINKLKLPANLKKNAL